MKILPDQMERIVAALLRTRASGLTLRLAAQVAGVHVATVCRWQKRNPAFRKALAKAAVRGALVQAAFRRVHAKIALTAQGEWDLLGWDAALPAEYRPHVRWRRDCPECRARVVVRTARGGARFWRCGRWPQCRWASWRPRAPRNCRRCGGPCYWSHSRKTISCGACGVRTVPPPNWAQ